MTGAVESCLDSALGQARHPRDLIVREVAPVAQHRDSPVVIRQLLKRALDDLLSLVSERAPLRAWLPARQRERYVVERQPGVAAAAQPIDTIVGADRQQPGRKAP